MTTATSPTAFADLNEVLREFADRGRATLGNNLVGLYLVGSFALGGADEHSDVDFMAIVARDVDGDELARLQAMHGDLHELPSEWARHLDGSYAPADLWRRPPAPGRPPGDDRPADWIDPGTGRAIGTYPFLYLDNGARSLVRSDHDNSLVVRSVTRRHGIALVGPPAETLIDPIDGRALRAEVANTIVEWGHQLLATPGWVSSLWRQAYLVVSYCRMLQTLRTGEIHSKEAGTRWAMEHVAPRWHGLVERAWAERPDPWRKIHVRPDAGEVAVTLDFVRSAIVEADAVLASPH